MEKLTEYIGKQFRYRYVDWPKEHWTPWTTLTPRYCHKMGEDFSIEKVQVMNEGERLEFHHL